jgi:hypothetical protein
MPMIERDEAPTAVSNTLFALEIILKRGAMPVNSDSNFKPPKGARHSTYPRL